MCGFPYSTRYGYSLHFSVRCSSPIRFAFVWEDSPEGIGVWHYLAVLNERMLVIHYCQPPHPYEQDLQAPSVRVRRNVG